MSDFGVSVFRIKVRGEKRVSLPDFPGSTLRGAFGLALRQISCVLRSAECDSCPLRGECAYAFSFESVFSGDSDYLKGTHRAPHPVLVYPLRLGGGIARKGGTYTFGMTVFGRARSHLPSYLGAIEHLGGLGLGRDRGRFEVVRIDELVAPRGWKRVYQKGSELKIDAQGGILVEQVLRRRTSNKRLILQTLTPLRMKSGGKLVTKPVLSAIVLGILTRLRVLSDLYSGEAIDLLKDLDVNELVKEVRVEGSEFRWRDYGRYSKRQRAPMRLGGLMGTMVISGNLRQVYPILKVGELIHLGKNTAFGLGRYVVKGGSSSERNLRNEPRESHI